jgi:hypothetical protein
MWLTQLMVSMVRKLRKQYRFLAYLDDVLTCPVRAGSVAIMRDSWRATQVIDKLLSSLGLTRHPKNGVQVRSTPVKHLACMIDSIRMRYYIASRKKSQGTWYRASYPVAGSARERCISRDRLGSFCGVCVSLSLPMPFARFYTRSLFDDMTRMPR